MRRALMGLGGTVLGLVFLYLAFGRADPGVVTGALREADGVAVLAAVGCYWAGLGLRVLRWRRLLQVVQPLGLAVVAEILLCGYAMNNLLPARLGEFFRADLAKRRTGMSRSTVLGSIVIERLLDLAAILCCLGLGLLELAEHVPALARLDLGRLLGHGTLLVLLLVLGLGLFWRLARRDGAVPGVLVRILANLRRGLATVRWHSLPILLALTVGVWSAEVLALWWVFVALGVGLPGPAAMIAMGAASLSTLVPTAPAYLGSYQLVFAAVMPALGHTAALGLAGATIIQLALFGSVTLAGILLLAGRAVHNAAFPRAYPVNADGREDPHSA